MLRLLGRERKKSNEDREKKGKNRVSAGESEVGPQNANQESLKAVIAKTGTIYGLEILYEPPDHSNAVVDIVFVHGLTGSSSNTWLDKKTGLRWPTTLLSRDVNDARMLSFGYDADVVNFWNPASQNRISDHAKNMLGALAGRREQTNSENRKIVFIVHSLGGLVTENALCLSRTSPDKHIQQVEYCTTAIAFLGTPHFGADLASWAKFGTDIANIVKRTNTDIVSVLKPGSEMLANIQNGFHSILRSRMNKDTEIAITCFFEELAVPVVGEVVPKHSAVLPGYQHYGIHANHMDMTKFADSNDSGYEAILREVWRWVRPLRLDMYGSDVSVEPFQSVLNLETPPQKTCFMVKFDRDPNFIGREDIMKEIGERLKMGQRRVAITGIGGVGKSRIAIEYCYKYRDGHPKAQVFWIHASNSTRFEEEYKDIAKELALPGFDDPDADILQLVYRWLSDDTNGSWLLVLDNADDMEVFFGSGSHTSLHQSQHHTAALASYLPRSSNGLMIITTRDRRVGERLANRNKPIPVLPFAPADAEYLLQCKVPGNDELNKVASTELVKALDYLALPITQAAAFISENGITIADYLEMLQAGNSDAKDILQEDLPDLGRDMSVRNSVFRAWELSFDQIRKQKPRAAEILSLMAVLDRQAISEVLLRNNDERKIEFITAIGTLKAFSLITEEQGGKTFGMHRLLQFSTQMWLRRQCMLVEWQEKALDVVSKCCPSDGKYENWAAWRAINPHVQVVLGYAFQGTSCLLQRASILNGEGWYNREQGQHKAAYNKLVEALAIREKALGPNHTSTLDTVHCLGFLYSDQDKLAEAEAMYNRALVGREKALGPNHTSTLDTVNCLGLLYSDQNRLAEAEVMYNRALVGRNKAFGPDHASTLDTVHNLGLLYEIQDKLTEAEAMYKQALAGSEKAIGPDHKSTLTTVNNLGNLYFDQGKLAEAEAMYNRALAGYEKALGPDHKSTLDTVRSLGRLYSDQGKLAEAEAMYNRALAGCEKILGPDHKSTLDTVHNLGHLYSIQGKLMEAEAMYNRALAGYEKILGPDHKSTLDTVHNLGRLYSNQGKLAEAEAMYDRALVGYEKILGPDHKSTLVTVNNLGLLYFDQGKLVEAEAMYNRALAGYEKILSPDHKSILVTAHSLGLLYFNQGKLVEAEAMYNRALAGYEKTLGPDHESTLVTVYNLGLLYKIQGKLTEAEAMYKQALAGSEKAFGPDHKSTLDTAHSLGRLYFNQGKLAEAEAMYDRALTGYEKTLGPDHKSTLNTVHKLGRLYSKQNRLAEAEAMYNRALIGYEKTLGPDHKSMLRTFHDLGLLYSDQGKLAEAEVMYNRALAGYEKILGPDHKSTLTTVNNLGCLYFDQGKLVEAEAMYDRALTGYGRTLGPGHKSTLRTFHNLGRLYSDQGKLVEAEAMYNRALAGYEKILGPDHKSTLDTAYNLGLLYFNQGKLAEAEAMYNRALAGHEKILGPDHKSTLDTAHGLGLLYFNQGKLAEAEAMYQQHHARTQ